MNSALLLAGVAQNVGGKAVPIEAGAHQRVYLAVKLMLRGEAHYLKAILL